MFIYVIVCSLQAVNVITTICLQFAGNHDLKVTIACSGGLLTVLGNATMVKKLATIAGSGGLS